MMCLWISYEEKNMKRKKNSLQPCNQWRKESEPELDPEPDPDPLVRGTDPGIRIRTKMSQIPNTGFDTV